MKQFQGSDMLKKHLSKESQAPFVTVMMQCRVPNVNYSNCYVAISNDFAAFVVAKAGQTDRPSTAKVVICKSTG